MIAATYEPTLFWIGFVLVLLGLVVQAVMWWAARKKAKDTRREEGLIEEIIKAILKLIEKGLYGVAITTVGLILMVASLGFGSDDDEDEDPAPESIALHISV